MKRLIPRLSSTVVPRMVAIALLVATVVLPPPSAARAEVVDRIVAIVNDDIVTLREVERQVTIEKKSRYTSMNEYVRGLELGEKLDMFVDAVLLKQQARKLKIEAGEKEVEATVTEIKKQHLISDSELKQQLQKENIAYEDFLEGIKMNIIRNRVLSRAISQEVNIDDKSLRAYYDSHPDDYSNEEYDLQQIFISGQRKDGQARARAALDALQKDQSFDNVANEYSDERSKGEVMTVNKAELIPELREALKLLMPGAHTPVIQTPYGYHILKLVKENKGARIPFEEVKDKVKEAIYQQESGKRYKEYMDKLKAASYIEIKI